MGVEQKRKQRRPQEDEATEELDSAFSSRSQVFEIHDNGKHTHTLVYICDVWFIIFVN